MPDFRSNTSQGGSFAGRAFGIGLVVVLVAVGVKLVLDPPTDERAPFLFLLMTVAAAAWYGGLLPGLATTLLAALLGDYLFVPAGSSFTSGNSGGVIRLGLFLAEGGLISMLAGRFHTSGHRNQMVGRGATRRQGSRNRAAESAVEPELEALNRLVLSLAGELDMGRLATAVTNAGVTITGAAFGAFLYREKANGPLQQVTAASVGTLIDFPRFQDAEAFGSPLLEAVAEGVSRSDDLAKDLRYGRNVPFKQMPPGHLPARSYLAAPVRSREGDLMGGLFFGHPEARFFDERDEHLLAGLAAHAAIACDNALLYRMAQQARASADTANGLKDEFLATLSHELRTPLTAIVGWAHLLQRGKLSPPETVRAVDTILRNATSQNQIIDELLDVSRIITGKLHLDLQPVDVSAVVKAAITTVAPAASAKGIDVKLIQSPEGHFLMGDPERLQQVFWNMLSNAIKFTSKDGRVRVSVDSVGSSIEVVVSDTGLGIDPEFLPRIFDRFTQDDPSSTRLARGLGVGLSIARQLVELHGGQIKAESPGLGRGSTFTASFPSSPVSATRAEPRHLPADTTLESEEGPDLTGVRVLVAEDDDDARGLIEKVLEEQGATVSSVGSAREALDILGREPIDVLLSDIEMPGTDGYQLIKELRLRPAHKGGFVPAAALTAYARTEDRLRALRAGFQIHLGKPVQPSELVTVVASLAARRLA